jgi:hypothetical protein
MRKASFRCLRLFASPTFSTSSERLEQMLSDVQSTVNHIKSEWDKLYPETMLDYSFLDRQNCKDV